MRPQGLVKTARAQTVSDSHASQHAQADVKSWTFVRRWPMLPPVARLQLRTGVDQKAGGNSMRLSVASSALAAAFVLMPVARRAVVRISA